MPLNTEVLPTYSREDFCLALKRARERKGITLAQIAQNTKIPAFMFAGLERNDLRRWPKGLFRRSFFRDYVRMIGLPVAEACAEFVRLFPDDPAAEVTHPPEGATEADQESDLRLSLDSEWHGPRASVLARLLAALIDIVIVLMAGAAVWMWDWISLITASVVLVTSPWARSCSARVPQGTPCQAPRDRRCAVDASKAIQSTGNLSPTSSRRASERRETHRSAAAVRVPSSP